MILATSASPSPDPVRFVVTNGSNRCPFMPSGTPMPLSTISIISGNATRAPLPGRDSRMPGRNAVLKLMRPGSPVSPIASAAFLTRLRNAWTSLSRLAGTGGSEGSYSQTNLMLLAKPLSAILRTWSRTSWILIGSFTIGRSSPNTSIRSTSLRIRSVSAQINWVN